MGFFEDFSHMTLPLDRNTNPASAIVAIDPVTGIALPLASTLLPDGSYALKTVTAGAMTLSTAAMLAAVTVTEAATVILAASATRKGHILYNSGAETVYVGVAAGVLTTTGIPVAAGATFNLDAPGTIYTGAIYGICAAGKTTEVRGITYTA